MNQTTIETGNTTEWSDAVAASFDAQNAAKGREEVTDCIDVPLNLERIKSRLDVVMNAIVSKQSALKAAKTDLDSSKDDLDEIIESIRSGVETVTGTFLVEDDFSTNTERWFWKDSGLLAREVPIPEAKHQLPIPFDLSSPRLDSDIAPAPDSTCGFSGDHPDDVSINAFDTFDAASNGTGPVMQAPPSKPIKRGGRKAKVS